MNSQIRGLEPEDWVSKHPLEFLMSIIHYVREDTHHIHVLVSEMREASIAQEDKIESLDMTVGETLEYIDKDTEKIMKVMTLVSKYAEKHRWNTRTD
jgi:hypothetical protein